MKYFGIVFLTCFFLFHSIVQAQSSAELITQGLNVLDAAANARDYDQSIEARTIFESVPEDDSLVVWAHYYAGTASSDLAYMLGESGTGGRGDVANHINNAIKHLETAVELDPQFADAWGLLAISYVYKISVRPLKALALSRRYKRAMDRAFELSPNNPRTKLIKGIIDYELPGIVGGDKSQAEKIINEAILIFETERIEHPFLPKWGHDQAYLRLGIIYMDRGDLSEARGAFERALELNPDFGRVKMEFMPQLEELESKVSES